MKGHLFALAAAAMLLSIVPRAEARYPDKPKPAWMIRNSLKYINNMLTKYCTIDTQPEDMERCKAEMKRAKKRLARVHPDNHSVAGYQKAAGHIAAVEQKIPGWEKKNEQEAESADNTRQLLEEFNQLRRRHGTILSLLNRIKIGKKYLSTKPGEMLRDIKRANKLGNPLKGCDRYRNLTTYYREGDSRHPATACELAASWKTLYTKYLKLVVEKVTKRGVKAIKHHLRDLAEKGKLYDSDIPRLKYPKRFIAKKRKHFAPVYEKLGLEMPAMLFQSFGEAAAPFASVMKKSARKRRWSRKARYYNRQVQRAFKRAARDEGFKYVRYGLTYPHWTIKKNYLGIPLRKIRSGLVMVKVKRERFCRVYSLTATSQFSGGRRRRHTTPVAQINRRYGGFLVSRCF